MSQKSEGRERYLKSFRGPGYGDFRWVLQGKEPTGIKQSL